MTMKLGRSSLVVVGLLGVLGQLGGCSEEPVEATAVAEPASLDAPPVISGGTLLVTRDGALAVAADSGDDAVYVVDLQSGQLLDPIQLQPGDEPGRVVEGADGRIHVALRRGGAVATIDLDTREVVRTPVCGAPRGLAWDDPKSQLHVACAGGELVSLDADLTPVRILRLEHDLRDVVVLGDRLAVSLFRAAEVLFVDGTGGIEQRVSPPSYVSPTALRNFEPAVAWRMTKTPTGQIAMVHQRGLLDPIPTGPSPSGQTYYGGFCDQVIVHAAVTVFGSDGNVVTGDSAGAVGTLVLPVDIAFSGDGSRMAVVGAGSETVFESSTNEVATNDLMIGCFPSPDQHAIPVLGEPVALAYDGPGLLVVQTRQPASLQVVDPRTNTVVTKVDFPISNRRHWGHALFHRAADTVASPIACASCHPEGRDDGRIWTFESVGARRTQNISGGVMATLPFHWDGELADMHDLMGEVFVNRMGGAEQPDDRIASLAEWVDTIDNLPAPAAVDDDAVARGDALFHAAEVGCASCHAGDHLTNNATVNVGTGKAFQVPSLSGIAYRAPFMHDGCAATLRDRLTSPTCGGGDAHGKTSQLGESQIDDLLAYLDTL
jgi:DNA-binding beta-propeller fold protein YncE/mono/diheme cytochrome c family protein